MRILAAAASAVLLIAAAPALAGERGHGGGHRPPPPPPSRPCCHGGGNANINVNVNANANANANASAQAFAGAGASSYFNARAYDVGGFRSGGSYGAVYVGGGYGGDVGYHGGGIIYGDIAAIGPACPSAPFGYVVYGLGREGRRVSRCAVGYRDHDRGGRYGYSDHRGYEHSGGYAREYESSSYEVHESYEESGWSYGEVREDRARDCDCREPAPYPPPYLPEPPRYEPPRRYELAPPPPRRRERPRQEYRQEPGERG